MKWLTWLKRITIAYIVIGIVVGLIFFALADFSMDWNWDNLKLFLSMILLWPLWVWFIVVMYMATHR